MPHNEIILIYLFWWIQNLWAFEYVFNTLRPRQNGRHFADDSFKHNFFNEYVWILIKISLKFVPKGPINKIPALFQIMAWHRPGVKPLSEAMLVSLLTHKCVTRPQWVKADIRMHPNPWPSFYKTMASGDARTQDISIYGVDLVCLEYSGFSTRRIGLMIVMSVMNLQWP